jgi:hypothetical protein
MKPKYNVGDVIAMKSEDAGTEFAQITAVMIKFSSEGKTVVYEAEIGPDSTKITTMEAAVAAAFKPYAPPKRRNRKPQAKAQPMIERALTQ